MYVSVWVELEHRYIYLAALTFCAYISSRTDFVGKPCLIMRKKERNQNFSATCSRLLRIVLGTFMSIAVQYHSMCRIGKGVAAFRPLAT